MFSSSKSTPSYSSESRPASGGNAGSTVIARGVKVEGDFSSEGEVVIEGQVNGSLGTSSVLTVGPDALIKADIKANEAHISGTVEGNVFVTKGLDISSSAKVTGDLTAETISVEAGAQIQGRVTIGIKAAPPVSKSPSPKAKPFEKSSDLE